MLKDRRHLYLTDDLWNTLRMYAKARGQTASGAIRELLATALDTNNGARAYVPDREHTRDEIERRAICSILNRVR